MLARIDEVMHRPLNNLEAVLCIIIVIMVFALPFITDYRRRR